MTDIDQYDWSDNKMSKTHRFVKMIENDNRSCECVILKGYTKKDAERYYYRCIYKYIYQADRQLVIYLQGPIYGIYRDEYISRIDMDLVGMNTPKSQ